MKFHSLSHQEQNDLVSDIVTKLERAERDLAILREAHKAHTHRQNDRAGITHMPNPAAYTQAAGRVSSYLDDNPDVRVAAFVAACAAPFPSGEVAEVLTPAAQEAKCWEVIERWHYESAHPGAPSRTLVVEFLGPYERPFVGTLGYCVRLPNGHTTDIKPSRLDALAHAAQWCQLDLDK